jgi:AcrR family transcriptional regulator
MHRSEPSPSPLSQARSRATKGRILAAARAQFARQGYDRTTIRTVAAEADADPALVMRYFGSKDGLFAAASTFNLHLPDFGTVPPDRLGETMIRHFLWRWEGDPNDPSLRILLRAGVTGAEAAARCRAILAEQVLPAIRHAAPDQQELRAGLIATQMLGLALCRYILMVPPIADLSPEAIIATVGPTVQRYLTAPLAAPVAADLPHPREPAGQEN